MEDGKEKEKEKRQRENPCCISHQFLNAATRNPSKVAVIHALARFPVDDPSPPPSPPLYDGDRCFTFADVSSAVDSLSSRLLSILDGGADDDRFLIKRRLPGSNICREAGEQAGITGSSVNKPKVLGIYMPPSVEYIISVLSVLRCGEAFLPLDPSWPRDRVLSVISSSSTDLVIACGSSFNKSGCQPLDRSHWLVQSGICSVLCFSMEEHCDHKLRCSNFIWPCKKEKQRAFCYLMYTSGSSGKPKGVCGTGRGLLNRFLWMQESYPVLGGERLLFKTSISFIDHLQEFLGATLTATTLIIPPFTHLKENIFSVVDFLHAYSISRLIAVPSMMRAILPTLQSHGNKQFLNSLKLLILSGEVLPVSLWDVLRNLLPNTSFLNLYGSTEVSGDCTYFDCRRLPKILEMERLTSVPIGMPISNCDVVLVGDCDKPDVGEIYVGGLCVSKGYLHASTTKSQDYVRLHGNSICNHATKDCGSQLYYKTGDYGQRLPSGDLVFLGRKDRTFKLNGQRIALEEIETTLRGHLSIADAAVMFHKDQEGPISLDAFIVLEDKTKSSQGFIYSVRKWMIDKLPLAMVPYYFVIMESLPISATGKVDYDSLAGLRCSRLHVQDEIYNNETKDTIQVIKKAFCDALVVEEVSDHDDFFAIGGDSLAAAHLSHSLGIDMRLLYKFPSPSKLMHALLEKKGLHKEGSGENCNPKLDLEKESRNTFDLVNHGTPSLLGGKPNSSLLRTAYEKSSDSFVPKRLKVDLEKYACPRIEDGNPWKSPFTRMQCSFSRCNKISYRDDYKKEETCQVTWSVELPRDRKVSTQELWKVHMESCVDASPLIVFKDSDSYLFIGSHSHGFLCINAKSGSVLWKTILEGRVEGSATVVGDFSQVAVGCYKGKIYFLDFSCGRVCWIFQASGEVKCQPVMDASRQLIWCGSHDHNLYALDYRNHCCVYKLKCGGSIFGSPAIDEDRGTVYVASTSGRVTAISTKAFPFHTLWLLELEVPIFGSLSVSQTNGNVICCLVDGHVVALSCTGSIVWRFRTGGPIFAGACISPVLPHQVLVCSRNGRVFSLEPENGDMIWEYNVGDPITASAYIDENLQLTSASSLSADRLICVCSSSGIVHVLRLNIGKIERSKECEEVVVHELTRLELQGDVFSSPVMIGGRIFVGCRDDYVHCVSVGT